VKAVAHQRAVICSINGACRKFVSSLTAVGEFERLVSTVSFDLER
jgi:hypothetical protein